MPALLEEYMSNSKLEKTQWLADARYGFFIHFLNPHRLTESHSGQGSPCNIDEWNREVDSFNVELMAREFAEAGAGYAFLTVGQNSGYYCSPNRVFDEIMGEKRCSERDLVAEFSDALAKYGIPCLVYTTGLAPYLDRKAVEKLECVPPWYHMSCNAYERYPDLVIPDSRLVNFQNKWNAIHREWAMRWGKKIKGWWVDGTHRKQLFEFPDEPNGKTFADALRAGNPDAILAFNTGDVVEPGADVPELEDYTAGEMNTPQLGICPGPLVDGLRYHILTYVGKTWWTGPVSVTGEFMAEVTRKVNDNGGAVSWDLPFSAEKGLEGEVRTLLADFKREYKKSLECFPPTSVAITAPRIGQDSSSIPGTALFRSGSLAGMEVEWNGKKTICEEGSEFALDLAPLLPDGDFVVTRNGVKRSYPVTTVKEFVLGEEFTAPVDLFQRGKDAKLSSISFAAKDGKFLLKGTIFEDELLFLKEPHKLTHEKYCSNLELYFSLDNRRKKAILIRADKNCFSMENKVLERVNDIYCSYSPLRDGKYEFYLEIPLVNLPDGEADVDSFKLNIAQRAFRNGTLVDGKMFGGRSKYFLPSYDAAIFHLPKKEK